MAKFKKTAKEEKLLKALEAQGLSVNDDILDVTKSLKGDDQKTFVGMVQRKLQSSDSFLDNINEFFTGFRLGTVNNEDRERFKMKYGLDPLKMLDQDVNAGNFVAKGGKFTAEMVTDFFTGGLGAKTAGKLALGAGSKATPSVIGEVAGAGVGGFAGKGATNLLSNISSEIQGVAPEGTGVLDPNRLGEGTVVAGLAGAGGTVAGKLLGAAAKKVSAESAKGGASKALFAEVNKTVTKIKNQSEKVLVNALDTIQNKYAKQKVAAQTLYKEAAKKAEGVNIDLTSGDILTDIGKLSKDAQEKIFNALKVSNMDELKTVSARNVNEFVKVLDDSVEGLFDRADSSKVLDFKLRERFNDMLPDEIFGEAKKSWKGFLDTFGRFDEEQTKQLAKFSKVRTKVVKGVGEAQKSTGASAKDAVSFFSKESTKPEALASALDLLEPGQAKEVLEASVFSTIKPTKKSIFEVASQLPGIEDGKVMIDELAENGAFRQEALKNSGAKRVATGAGEGGLFTESSFKGALDSLDQAGGRLSKVAKGTIKEMSDKLKGLSSKSANAESLASNSLKKELNPNMPTGIKEILQDSVADNALISNVAGAAGKVAEPATRIANQGLRAALQADDTTFSPYAPNPTMAGIDDVVMATPKKVNELSKLLKSIGAF